MRAQNRDGKIPLGFVIRNGRRIPVWLPLAHLQTHLHVIGPPGTGKSRMLLWLFECLCFDPRASIVVFNPKGALCRMARDFAISAGFAERLIWIDPGSSPVIGYNPLLPNDLPVATHAKAVREGVRSAWQQSSFDATPQLARLLFLALAVARSLGLSLDQAVVLLRGQQGAEFREVALRRLSGDTFLHDLLLWFHSLPRRRQEELAASSLARLESFLCEPIIQQMLTKQPSINLADAVTSGKIILVNLEIGRPLRLDDVRLLGRFLVNDVVGQRFAHGSADRPAYLILDECHHFATADLCHALDMGRELGLHCILAHQHLGQLKGDDGGLVYDSILTSARTKVVFGGLTNADLNVLSGEMVIEDFTGREVKDQITTLELDPVETVRAVRTRTTAVSSATAVSDARTRVNTTGRTHGRSRQRGTSEMAGNTFSESAGTVETATDTGPAAAMPSPEGITHSVGHADVQTVSNATSHASGSFETDAEHTATLASRAQGRTSGRTVTSGAAASEGSSVVPFYTYRKRHVVSSRTFVSEQEFLTRWLIRMKGLAKAHFAVKTPGHSIEFVVAPRVPRPSLLPSILRKGLAAVFSAPWYGEKREAPNANSCPSTHAVVDCRYFPANEGSTVTTSCSVRTDEPATPSKSTPWDGLYDETKPPKPR